MSQPTIVHFPCLVPEALTPGAPAALLLEPGLRKSPDRDVFLVPDGLPMDRRQAKAWLAQSLEFADRFQHRGELSAVSAVGLDDFYSGSSLDIQSQLRSMDGAPAGDDLADQARRRAQMVLLLAAGLEERLAEISALNQKLGNAWQGMAESLGLEEDDDQRLTHVMDVAPGAPDASPLDVLDEYGLSWPMLLEAVCCFLPQDAALVVTDPSLLRAWRDKGIDLSAPAEPMAGWGSGALVGSAPARVWSGREKMPPDMPWLDQERTVIFVPAWDESEEPS